MIKSEKPFRGNFLPGKLKLQKIKLQMGAGTIELDGDFKAEQMEVNVGPEPLKIPAAWI